MALQRQQHNLRFHHQPTTTARQSRTKGHPAAARPRQRGQHIMPRQQTAQSLLPSLQFGLSHSAAKWQGPALQRVPCRQWCGTRKVESGTPHHKAHDAMQVHGQLRKHGTIRGQLHLSRQQLPGLTFEPSLWPPASTAAHAAAPPNGPSRAGRCPSRLQAEQSQLRPTGWHVHLHLNRQALMPST